MIPHRQVHDMAEQYQGRRIIIIVIALPLY